MENGRLIKQLNDGPVVHLFWLLPSHLEKVALCFLPVSHEFQLIQPTLSQQEPALDYLDKEITTLYHDIWRHVHVIVSNLLRAAHPTKYWYIGEMASRIAGQWPIYQFVVLAINEVKKSVVLPFVL